MRRKRTPKWATVQRVLGEASKVTFLIERGPMAPDRYLSCTYDDADGIEQRVHRATAPNLRKALQGSRGSWILALVTSTATHIEQFVYHRLVHLKPPPLQAGAPAAPDVH